MQAVRRKRRIRMDRVMILIAGALLCLLLVVGIIFGIFKLFNPTLIAQEYRKPNMEIKLEDDKVISKVYTEKNEETEEKMIYAIHVPKFNNEEVTKMVNDFVDKVKADQALVTHIDYQSTNALGKYKSYILTAMTYSDMEKLNPLNPIKSYELYINFENDQYIELDDCIRLKAIDKLENEYNAVNSQLVSINQSGVVIDLDGQKINYTYKDHPNYFVMNHPDIPSILKYEKIEVEQRELDPNKPMVAFTFDDGPHPTHTLKILEALDKVGGRATFFELGYLMEAYPDVVRAITEQGSEVANHSYDHDWLTSKTLEEAIADIDSVNDIYFSLTGQEIQLVRPPYGDYNKSIREALVEGVVLWDVDTRDWESRNASSVVAMTKKYTYDGAVVLFHDIYSSTANAAVELIEYYDSLGYQFVTVSELRAMKGE